MDDLSLNGPFFQQISFQLEVSRGFQRFGRARLISEILLDLRGCLIGHESNLLTGCYEPTPATGRRGL